MPIFSIKRKRARDRCGGQRHDCRQHQIRRRRRRVGGQRRDNLELHDLAGRCRIRNREVDTRHATAKRLIRTDVAEYVVAHRDVGEIDDHVGALGQAHQQPVAGSREVDRRREETALVADLPDLDTRNVGKVQDQHAGLAAVQEAEAIATLLYGLERPGVAVDHDRVAEELRIPDRREAHVSRDKRADDRVEELPCVRVEQ